MTNHIIHDIYPSSKVSPEDIANYGWVFVENIPAQVNEQGRLAPTPERRDVHINLRSTLGEVGTISVVTSEGEVIEARDFAIAVSPSTPDTLGFFALK